MFRRENILQKCGAVMVKTGCVEVNQRLKQIRAPIKMGAQKEVEEGALFSSSFGQK